MRALPAPVGHPDFVMGDVSWDASTFLFRDDDTYDRLYVSTPDGVSPIAPPGDDDGTIFGQLRPDGRLAVVARFDGMWRVDLPSGAIRLLPAPPNGTPFWMDILDDGTVLILAGEVAGPLGGATSTVLWAFDLATEQHTRLGSRSDLVIFTPFDGGIVAGADGGGLSLHLELFTLRADGAERPLYDASGYGWLAVHPRLKYLALSKGNGGEGGAFLVDLETLDRRQLFGRGMVDSFSPDGSLIAIRQQGGPDEDGLPELYGPMRIVNLQGDVVETFPDSRSTVWVGIAAQ